MAETKPFTNNKFDKVATMRGAFESQYGAPANDNKKVLIGMRGGKAVYGDELDATDTSGKNVINNTYSQNQAIMDDMFKGMKQSGGVYNPPPPRDIATTEQKSPVTVTDNQFAATLSRLNARTNPTSVGVVGKPEAPASTAAPTSNAREDNTNYLLGLNNREKGPSLRQSDRDGVTTLDYRPERDGVAGLNSITTSSGQKPKIFGRTIDQMSPEERGLWTKKPEGISFDKNGFLFGTAQMRSPEEEAEIREWEESELQNNPEVRNRRIKTYEDRLAGVTADDPPEIVASAKKELERLKGMGKKNTTQQQQQKPQNNPYQNQADNILAFGENPADWGL